MSGIPTLVLLDEKGTVVTRDGRGAVLQSTYPFADYSAAESAEGSADAGYLSPADAAAKIDWERLTLSADTLQHLCSSPLAAVGLDTYVALQSRADRGLGPVEDDMPFDVSRHPDAHSEVAVKMQKRLADDVKVFAHAQNTGTVAKCVGVLDADVAAFFADPRGAKLRDAIAHTEKLMQALTALKESDAAYVDNALLFITAVANRVPAPDLAAEDGASALRKLQFVFGRYCGQETELWLDYLIGSLLSSRAVHDLQKLNPFFAERDIEGMYSVAVAALMHANRVGQTNRSLSDARELLEVCMLAHAHTHMRLHA